MTKRGRDENLNIILMKINNGEFQQRLPFFESNLLDKIVSTLSGEVSQKKKKLQAKKKRMKKLN